MGDYNLTTLGGLTLALFREGGIKIKIRKECVKTMSKYKLVTIGKTGNFIGVVTNPDKKGITYKVGEEVASTNGVLEFNNTIADAKLMAKALNLENYVVLEVLPIGDATCTDGNQFAKALVRSVAFTSVRNVSAEIIAEWRTSRDTGDKGLVHLLHKGIHIATIGMGGMRLTDAGKAAGYSVVSDGENARGEYNWFIVKKQ